MTTADSVRIDFEGLVNARDVGLSATSGGHPLRSGVLFRSETPELMSAADAERAAREIGIGRVVDLRGPRGASSGPLGENGRRVEVDFFGLVGVDTVDPSPDGVLASILDHGGRGLVAFLHHFVATDSPVLVHCHTGKDRTGFVVAMTLALAGVADDAIVADYQRSEPVYDAMVANLEAAGLGVPASAPAYARHRPSTAGVIDMLKRLRTEWGSAEEWALDQAIPEQLVDGLRSRLTAPRAGER